ncbi:hypothetical protein MTR62_08605 [Novosphingobium sp. 1949]|uniref:Uncharacterized protein n=1 Tax=Novosphingobium organovorum TaxID=2930092 RepID=A0ABT0BCH1_9SPHN|nr:hypothetical protein [Novosphingobium organovorum]MCJ2182750.1 hypothetical protein [Novosphingobium organovorum]
MKKTCVSRLCAVPLLALGLAAGLGAGPVLAQTSLESGSNAAANSGSVSGAQSQSNPTNVNAPVNSQGNLTSTSDSSAGAVSGSSSGASSDQGQSQGQEANNAQIQAQGQLATNEQGVTLTFNQSQRKIQRVYTNAPVPLAASSSFSSDYCGGTASAGASVAPIGISLGGAKPTFDKSCQSLRRAEKFGMAAANAANMGQPELAGRLMSMMIWSICTSDSDGPKGDRSTAMACDAIGLLGSTASTGSAGSAQPVPAPAPEPATTGTNGEPTPAAAVRQPPQATTPPELELVARR